MPAETAPALTATYRLQLHAGFTFDDAAAQVDYLADLGVSHLYLSPVLQASAGSTHGYDVRRHDRLADDLGGEQGWQRLVRATRAHGLGIIVDVVPNHVCVDAPQDANPAWWGLLAGGVDGRFGRWFDVDTSRHHGKVLVPVLGAPVEQVLDELVVDRSGPRPVLRYHDHLLPLVDGTDRLDLPDLLAAQHYELAFWKRAATELNYRRFFDVTTLAGVRVEDPTVFTATHALLTDKIRAGEIHGLRIDHPDGLADPGGYLEDLAAATDGAWVVVEKILEAGEQLPSGWACAGTTGYDTLNDIGAVLTDPRAQGPLTELYAQLTGQPTDARKVLTKGKRHAATQVLASEVTRLARGAALTEDERAALIELLVAMPVYRAYLRPGEQPGPIAAHHLDTALAEARAARPDLAEALDTVRGLVVNGPADFVVRFQQTCGPVMAKGVEDTAFYRYHRLTAHNEVGNDLTRFALSPAAFHGLAERRQRDWPRGMTTLSTHDTKRSEDVRARLLALAGLPTAWAQAVDDLESIGAAHLTGDRPDTNVRYLMWQTFVGAWPLPADRAVDYALKAAREAKQHTAWVDGDADYERALTGWVTGVADDPAVADRITALLAVLRPVAKANGLAQKLLQLTLPGVPDVYQGTEHVELSLVDPDNRRPVDYDARRASLAAHSDVKQQVVAAALRLRRRLPAVFAGSYRALEATGPRAGNVLAFVRGEKVATVVTRLAAQVEDDGWGPTELLLGPGVWHDVLANVRYTGPRVGLDDLCGSLPVVLLVRES